MKNLSLAAVLLLLGLGGCAAKKPDLVVALPQPPAAHRYWVSCSEVLDVNSAKDEQTFDCLDIHGEHYIFRISRKKK